MRSWTMRAALALTLALTAPSVSAQDAPPPQVPAEVMPPEVKPTEVKPTKVTADLAYIQTAGNTEVTTITGGEKIEHKLTKWSFMEEVRAVWGETDGEETAGRYDGTLRGDYFVSERVSPYLLGVWRRNVFAGISHQFEEGVGVSWHAVVTKPHVLDLELGAGLLQRQTTLDENEDFTTGRGALLYQYYFTEKAYFESKGSYLMNLEDTSDSQVEARLSLVAPIAAGFSVKLGYDLYFRSEPQLGLEDLDTTLSAGLQFVR